MSEPLHASGNVIIGIDPGPDESAIVIYRPDRAKYQIELARELSNKALVALLSSPMSEPALLVIEWIESYGMAVGRETFETCRWVGRFEHAWALTPADEAIRLTRKVIKRQLCGNHKADQSMVTKRLIDMFGPTRDVAVGIKARRGPLYEVKGHCWAALAVAVAYCEGAEPYSYLKPTRRTAPAASVSTNAF